MEEYLAPKDPLKQRSFLTVLEDAALEAKPLSDKRREDTIYLSGRLAEQIRLTYPEFEPAGMLETCMGFRQLVYSIGVSILASDPSWNSELIQFELQIYGKEDPYGTGTKLTAECPCSGEEQILVLKEQNWESEDNVLGAFHFTFPNDRRLTEATATVRFYLNDTYEVMAQPEETPVDITSNAYREMISNSILSTGSDGRLRAVLNRAVNKEPITIACIGGSITQGAGAKPIAKNCYACQWAERLKNRTGNQNIQLIKAGVGGTSSELGVVRLTKDIFRDGNICPDLVVIEFAVNDEGDETKGRCYESLIRTVLLAPKAPAVVLLFAVFMNDWNLQERLAPIGAYYGLPMVSVKNAVCGQFREKETRVISKQQFFYDIYHPSNLGHQIMADCLDELMKQSLSEPEENAELVTKEQKKPFLSDAFTGMQLLDRSHFCPGAVIRPGGFFSFDRELQCVELDEDSFATPQFPDNWMYNGLGEPFCLLLCCKSLILVFKDSGSAEVGSAEVWVDGTRRFIANPHKNNWVHCNAVLLIEEKEATEHRIELRMCPGDERKQFTILGFGYT